MAPERSAGRADEGTSLTGRVLAGRFRVGRALGAGGMASVWLADDERLHRTVVVKLPHAALLLEPGFRKRFEREVSSLSAIEHPHVVKVIDAGEIDDRPYAVLQHLPGGSLRDRLDAHGGRMPAMEVLPWLAQAAAALDHVHRRGLVHRDVKPGNLLYDEADYVVLADFGIAKDVGGAETQLTATGTTPGSPGYMAPEAIRGADLSPAYDQFSLGVTAYESLAGRLPFDGATSVELLASVLNGTPRDLGDLVPDLPAHSAAAVMRAIAKDPRDRWPNCRAFAEAFGLGLGVTLGDPRCRALTTGFRRGLLTAPSLRRRGLQWVAAVAAALAVGGAGWHLVRAGTADPSDSGPRAPSPDPRTAAVPSATRDLGEPPWKLVTPPEGPAWARVSEVQVEEARRLGVAVAFESPLGMRFVLIPPGRFNMGSPDDEPGRDPGETQREVEIPSAFYLAVHEVTNAQFRSWSPAHHTRSPDMPDTDGDDQPAGRMTRVSAISFAEHLGARDSRTYRLPTEAEWEYACRAGTTGQTYWGDLPGDVTRHANFADRRLSRRFPTWAADDVDDGFAVAAPVGSFLPSPWGLHDMLGNVCEMVVAEGSAKHRMVCGGYWGNSGSMRRAAARRVDKIDGWSEAVRGIRLVSDLPGR